MKPPSPSRPPRGSTDAVDVGFRLVRQIVVHDVGNRIDVDSARGNIGGDEHRRLVDLEVVQRPLAGVLGLVAMDRLGTDAAVVQSLNQAIRPALGSREDDRASHRQVIVQMRQERGLIVALDKIDRLFNIVGGGRHGGDLHVDRVIQQRIGQVANFRRHGGAKEKRLPLFGDFRHDLADIVDESHVKHAVGFVKDQHFDAAQIAAILLHQVEQSARRGNQDIDALSQRLDLGPLPDAAENNGRAQRHVFAIDAEAIGGLRRQFACRAKHQTADDAARSALAWWQSD